MDYILVVFKHDNTSNGFGISKLRQEFLKNIQHEGLAHEIDTESDDHVDFIKLHVDQKVVEKYCELLKWKLPVKREIQIEMNEYVSNTEVAQFSLFSILPPSQYKMYYEYSNTKRYL